MAELYENEQAVSQYSANVNNNFPDFARSIVEFVKAERCISDTKVKMEFLVDAGCGSGGSTRIFAPFFKRILGVDPSEEQVTSARNETNDSNIEFRLGSGESLPVQDGTVDLIVSYFAIQYMDLPKYVAECKRVLKQDGLALSFGHDYSNIELLNSDKPAPSVQGLLQSFFRTAKVHFDKNLPQVGSWLDRYQSIYDKITGINKQRVDNITCQQQMKLADFKRRLLSIPEYRDYNKKEYEISGKHPIGELMDDIKRRWELTEKSDKDISINIMFSFFIIFLKK